MDEVKKKMTKEEFEKWCNNYGIFHFLNVDCDDFCSYRIMCPDDRTYNEFLKEEGERFHLQYSNIRWYSSMGNEHVVFINY